MRQGTDLTGVQDPAWAPDGKRIVVSYLDRIWTMTPDGKQARAVSPDAPSSSTLIERDPAWSPDGTRIAFAADRGEGFDIYVVAIKPTADAKAAAVPVTTMPGDERWPSWTPDGRLVFAHRDDEPHGRAADPGLRFDLYLIAPVPGSDAWQSPVPLTQTSDNETEPRVSPNGERVVFVSDRESDDDVDLWAMSLPAASVARPVPLGGRAARATSDARPATPDARPATPDARRPTADARPPTADVDVRPPTADPRVWCA